MKRKSSRKSVKSDEDENGFEVEEENDISEEPHGKKGRKSRGRKSKQGKATETESDVETGQSEGDESDGGIAKENGNTQEKRGRKSKGKKPKGAKPAPSELDAETGQSEGEESDSGMPKENGNNQEKRGRKSKGKKSKGAKPVHTELDAESTEETDPLAGDTDAEYEVEAVLDDKVVKGVKHYLIRWKGYTEESDTWEPEHTIDCKYLISEYKEKKKSDKKVVKKKGGKEKREGNDSKEDWDENEDFEVDRIIDVYFHRNGKRDFLVSWKGYPASQNSWEPENNMDCKDLIKKYMEKVEEAKRFEGKESKLRSNPRPVNRLEFSMHETSRRLSKRHSGKDRVHYFDAE